MPPPYVFLTTPTTVTCLPLYLPGLRSRLATDLRSGHPAAKITVSEINVMARIFSVLVIDISFCCFDCAGRDTRPKDSILTRKFVHNLDQAHHCQRLSRRMTLFDSSVASAAPNPRLAVIKSTDEATMPSTVRCGSVNSPS